MEMTEAEEKTKTENTNLLKSIARTCLHGTRNNIENILLIGMTGAGKSAIVNTIIKPLTGTYIPRAQVGNGNTTSKTRTLTRYENCGVRHVDIEENEDVQHRDLITTLLEGKRLPTIIDFAGQGDNDTNELQYLLENIIGGYVNPGTSIDALTKKEVIDRIVNEESNPAWKVTKVVFVQGCHDAVPYNLIKCLQTVLKKTDDETGVSLYTQDVFIVITKYDLVIGSPFQGDSAESHMSMEDLEKKEKEIAEHFNIVGALEHNRIRWVSYTDNIGYDSPLIDNIALTFLKRMVIPGINKESCNRKFTLNRKPLASKVEEENTELLKDIVTLCRRKDRTNIENVLLIGMSGGGKSGVVNTVIKVLAGSYIQRADMGMGETISKTLTLKRYENCGVREEDTKSIRNEVHKYLIQTLLEAKLPTLIDVAGQGDTNTEEMQEILELLIGGYVQPDTSIETLVEMQGDHGVGTLKDTIKPNPAWKVNKVVFVQGCHDAVPHNLIKCLQTVLKKTDGKTGVPLYTQDVFIVITKYDLVIGSPFQSNYVESHMSMEDFEKTEKEIAEHFNIVGALEHNRIRWVSYTDNIGYDSPLIDNIALKFLKHLINPSNVGQESPKHVMSTWKKLKLYLNRSIRESEIVRNSEDSTRMSIGEIFLFWVIVFVAIYVMLLGIVHLPYIKETSNKL